MKITRTSPFSKKQNTMDLDVTPEQLDRWQGGEMIQDVFPHLSADEREFLKTGITKAEWDDLFGSMDEEDNEDVEEDDGHNGY